MNKKILHINTIKKYSQRLSGGMLAICILFSATTISAQSISATLKADSSHIVIGDPVNVKLTVKHSAGYQIAWPRVADTLGSLDIISAGKLDTTTEGANTVLSQTYSVSAYDSGSFHGGPVKVFFKTNTGVLDSVISNPVFVDVATIDVDTTKAFKAIKAPLEVPYVWQEFLWYIIGGTALLILLIVIAIVLWQLKKRKPAVVERPRPKDPAHIWARKELKKLDEEKRWQQDDVKGYYSRLTEILRLYLEYRFNWMALESTTQEIEAEISQYEINDVAKNLLLETLRSSDFVKFAKMQPMPDANMKAMENAKGFIEMTVPVEVKTEAKK